MRRTVTTLVTALLAISVVTQKAQGQANRDQPNKPTQPGEHHRRLDNLAGSWEVLIKFKVAPGQEREGKAICESRWVLDGRFLKQEYRTMAGGMPFTVLQYLGYDYHRNKSFVIKMDSTDTGIQYTEGTISDDGKVIVNIGLRTDPNTSKNLALRTVTTVIDLSLIHI